MIPYHESVGHEIADVTIQQRMQCGEKYKTHCVLVCSLSMPDCFHSKCLLWAKLHRFIWLPGSNQSAAKVCTRPGKCASGSFKADTSIFIRTTSLCIYRIYH